MTQPAHRRSRRVIALTLACVVASAAALAASCGEPLGYYYYRFCDASTPCASGASCVQVAGRGRDGGTVPVGICTTPCTTSIYAEGVYAAAGADAATCVGVDANGSVDTTNLGGPGWLFQACGNDHLLAGHTDTDVICSPYDYGGYPIDLWIPYR